MSRLHDALAFFMARYHERPNLVAEQRGWDRTIRLIASDSGASLMVRVLDGRIIELPGPHDAAHVVIRADENILCDILELRSSPNEPYLFGELTVRGAEADFIRLDYITGALCPG